jgi:proton-dependent oligopeptide transporter, POT family
VFRGHPPGLFVLFLASMGERFGWYTMIAVLTFFLQERYHWSASEAGGVYSTFMMAIYLMPLLGGPIADRHLGYGRAVAIGSLIMAAGYAMMVFPTDNRWFLYASLGVICLGTGLFKGNLAVLVGNLYESPELAHLRDAAYNIYYMGINCGAFLAPYAANAMKRYVHRTLGRSLAEGYHAAFAASVVGLLLSFLVFILLRRLYRQADYRAGEKQTAHAESLLSAQQVRERLVAMGIVFVLVIFFWMIFQQNGLTLSLFARDYTVLSVDRYTFLIFDLWGLLALAAIVLGVVFAIRRGAARTRALAALAAVAGLVLVWYRISRFAELNSYDPELFQAFNPLFIVFFTPIVVGFFGWLSRRSREPSAPAKIALGMLVTAFAVLIIVVASIGLRSPAELAGGASGARVSPYWLISSYFLFTLAELCLSPMGLSFVSKVAPPRLRGLMQGAWLASIAVGNKLIGLIGWLYDRWPLWQTFALMVGAALVAALALLLVLKKVNAATASRT